MTLNLEELVGAGLGWQPGLVTLHAVSGVLIALAYLTIAAAAWSFLRHASDACAPRHRHCTCLGRNFAEHEPKQGRLA